MADRMAARLRELFARSGQLHTQRDARLRGDGRPDPGYGYELRFAARGMPELMEIHDLLEVVGIKFGRAWVRKGYPVLPIYGIDRV